MGKRIASYLCRTLGSRECAFRKISKAAGNAAAGMIHVGRVRRPVQQSSDERNEASALFSAKGAVESGGGPNRAKKKATNKQRPNLIGGRDKKNWFAKVSGWLAIMERRRCGKEWEELKSTRDRVRDAQLFLMSFTPRALRERFVWSMAITDLQGGNGNNQHWLTVGRTPESDVTPKPKSHFFFERGSQRWSGWKKMPNAPLDPPSAPVKIGG